MRGWNIIIVVACLWLTACSPQHDLERHFDTYLTRVASVLGVPAPALTSPQPLPELPPQRELVLAPARISTGLLDSLKLNRCDLLGLVGKHNDPVGRSQSAAGQLLYHLQFQQGLTQCLQESDDQELNAWLMHIIEQKQPQLLSYHWNMMIAEPEIRQALAPAHQSLPFKEQAGYYSTLHAFRLFTRWQELTEDISNNTERLTSQSLSEALSGLYQNPYLGELFYSLHSAAHYLEQSLTFLQALDDFNCGSAQQADAKRLRNAMQHYYAKDIQAYLAKIDRQFVQLAPLLQSTLTPPDSKQALMINYQQQIAQNLESTLYVRYRQLTLEHAKLWQRFLKRCDIPAI